MPNHHKLQVWHRANALSLDVHRAARRIRSSDAPGLKPQLLRAVTSIAANLGEGAGDRTRKEFAHFVTISIGSATETETHLLLARGLALIPEQEAAHLLDELDQVRRMLFGLRKHLLRPGP